MNIEKQIIKRMKEYGYTRLEAIASMDLGERSEAAKRALAKRARRRELMEHGMSFAHNKGLAKLPNLMLNRITKL